MSLLSSLLLYLRTFIPTNYSDDYCCCCYYYYYYYYYYDDDDDDDDDDDYVAVRKEQTAELGVIWSHSVYACTVELVGCTALSP